MNDFLDLIGAVQLLSCIQFFTTPWTAARQAPLSFTISQSLLKLMSIESLKLSKHLIFCHPLLLLPSIFPSIRVFSNESAFHITICPHENNIFLDLLECNLEVLGKRRFRGTRGK